MAAVSASDLFSLEPPFTPMTSDPRSFSHFFNNNVAPRPLEGASIQEKIDGLTSDIIGVKYQLESLQRELKRLEDGRHSYQALLSPLRRIPLEILGEIFLTILADIDPERSERFMDAALIDLCLVCRAWRNAALATPRLWSYLVLDGLPSPLRPEVVSRWFSRSGVAPKTLHVCGDSHWPCEGPEGCEFSNVGLAKLLTEGPQLGHLVLLCTSSQCFRNLISLMKRAVESRRPRPLDTIKSLKLAFACDWNEPPSPSDSIFLHISSSVTTLHLSLPPYYDLPPDEDDLNLPIPESILSNLTTFTLECDWGRTKMWKVLQLCKNVETLTLDYGFSEKSYHDDEPYFLEVVHTGLLLPKVHTLRLRHMHPNVTDFIHLLKTPMLVELDISFSNFSRSPAPCSDLEDVLDSFCHALIAFSTGVRTHRKLRLHAVKLSKPQVRLIFTALPRLNHLTLDNVWFDGSIFRDFSHELWNFSLSCATPLPFIQTLELLNLPVDFPLRLLKRYINDRYTIAFSGSLKRVIVTYQRYYCPIEPEGAELREHCPVKLSVGFVKSGSG